MRIETEVKSEKFIYRIIGDIKFYNWDEVSSDLMKKYHEGHKCIIMNWQGVSRIDSSAMQTLVTMMKTAQIDPDFRFYLVTDNQVHLRTLELCRLDKYVEIVASESEAFAKCPV